MKKAYFLFLLTLIFIITACDRVPEFKSSPITAAYEGSEYNYQVEATDPDGKSIKYFLIQGPQGMKLLINNTVAWTPTYNDIGEHSIRIKADDSVKYTIQDFNLTVSPQVTGYAYYLNLSDENFYGYQGLTINISGNGVNTSTTTAPDGNFYFRDIQPGEYRYDITSPDGQGWSFYSSERTITFITPLRIISGNAAVSGTVASKIIGTRSAYLTANIRSVNLADDYASFSFTGLFATHIESLIAKQMTWSTRNSSGIHFNILYPKTYAFIYPLPLSDGETLEYQLELDKREIVTRWIWVRTDGAIYKIEYYGFVRMPSTAFQFDLSAYTEMTNQNSPNLPIPIVNEYQYTNVSYGQNHEKIYFWYGYSGWSPYKAFNHAEGDNKTLDLGYPLNLSVSGGQPVSEYMPAELMKAEEPRCEYERPQNIDSSESLAPAMSEIIVDVINGVGTTPTFRWYGPHTGVRNPEIYVATVVEVNNSNQYVRTIWKGITQKGEIQFPSLSQPLLQTGKKYVFYVTAYCGEDYVVSQDDVLWFPEDLNYWFSRSAGVIFTP